MASPGRVSRRLSRSLAAVAAGALLSVSVPWTAAAGPTLTQVSSDPFDAPTIGQHHSEVEPDTFAWGNTEVAVFQVGRVYNGGATTGGFATYTGGTWHRGLLPGLTTGDSTAPGRYDKISDASITYDAAHGVWLASTLGLLSGNGVNIAINRSADGLTWQAPFSVIGSDQSSLDKSWIVCDNTVASPHYGTCYSTWDDVARGDLLQTSTSIDGGKTWSAPLAPAPGPPIPPSHFPTPATGLGGQPVVQPNGNLIVPAWSDDGTRIIAYQSTDGGASYSQLTTVATIQTHTVGGPIRTEPLPSAEIDGSGTVYVVWQDCRFRTGCSANDIVMSTTTDGATWTTPARIPIDDASSTVEHFIPGIAVDRGTSGSTTHLALTYYYYPDAACTAANCQLDVGFVSSVNGGTTWSAPQQLAGPMSIPWLPQTSQNPMVGDYISTSILANGTALPVFAVAKAPTGGVLDQAMYSASLSVNGPTVAHVTRIQVRFQHGVTLVRWHATTAGLRFNVYDGATRLNRRFVTSTTHWYRFSTPRRLHHLRILAIQP